MTTSSVPRIHVDLNQSPLAMEALKKHIASADEGAARGRTLEGTNLADMETSRSYREPSPSAPGFPRAEPGRPLPAALLCRRCDPAELPFELVTELEEPSGPIGQDRAVEAVDFAVQMRRKGYNIYALGPSGTGKHTIIGDLLRRQAESAPTPSDCATSTTLSIHRNRADCNCRRGAPSVCAKQCGGSLRN